MYFMTAIRLLPYVIILGLGLVVYVYRQDAIIANQQREVAENNLNEAVSANKEAQRTIDTLKEQAEKDRRAIAEQVEADRKRRARSAAIKKENQDAPDSNTDAGLYFDDFADRLRVLDSGQGGN